MVQTQRSVTALYAVLPDNTAGDISPEDVRDIVETLRHGHGEISTNVAAETSIAVGGTYVKVAGTTTLTADNHNWTMPQDNRLTYGGTANRVVHLALTVSFTAAGNNKNIRFRIAKNGTTVARSEVQRFVATGADVGSTALHLFDSVAPTDYYELWATNMTDTVNLTVEQYNMFIMDMSLI